MSWPEDGQAEGVNSLLLSLYVLFGALADWIRPTHAGEGNLLDSAYQLKWSSQPETPSWTHPESCLTKYLRSLWPNQLTHEIHHHS